MCSTFHLLLANRVSSHGRRRRNSYHPDTFAAPLHFPSKRGKISKWNKPFCANSLRGDASKFLRPKEKNRATRVQHKVYVANHDHPKSVLFKNHFLILISQKRTTFADVFVFEFSRRRLLCCVGLRAAATSSSILLLISKLKPISHIQKEKRRPLFRPRTHAEEEEEDAKCHLGATRLFLFPSSARVTFTAILTQKMRTVCVGVGVDSPRL